MSVFVYDEDAFEKIVAVEGEGFREWQDERSPCSFRYFLDYWKRLTEADPELKKFELYISPTKDSSAIWGWHGLNRYLVRWSGEIVFLVPSDDTINKKYAKRAQKLGFDLSSSLGFCPEEESQ